MLNRRRFLTRSILGLGGVLGGCSKPPPRREPTKDAEPEADAETVFASLPVPTSASGPHLVQSGDVTDTTAIVWGQGNAPSTMLVEWSVEPSFRGASRVLGPTITKDTDFTGQVELRGLPPGSEIQYRVAFEALEGGRQTEWASGALRTAPVERRDVLFAWSGDTAGQGWGIDPARGGMQIYATMLAMKPEFFIHCGDLVYADNVMNGSVRLADGTSWHNLLTPAKTRVAESLEDFRGNYRYNFLDEHFRRFHAHVPLFAIWDDHEVRNNWSPRQMLEDAHYAARRVSVLAERARRAMREYVPMRAFPDPIYRSFAFGPSLELFLLDGRSYRANNSRNLQPTSGRKTSLLGATQLAWLKESVARSTATWKIIAIDQPLGLLIPDVLLAGGATQDGWANGSGPPLGRELELADLLRFLRGRRIRNVVWLTADVHYAAAHRYQPERARFRDFDAFWEFVAGPLHAGAFPPRKTDDTFGLEVIFHSGEVHRDVTGPPTDGHQHFGTVHLDGASQKLTVALRNLYGRTLWEAELEPAT